MGGADPLLLWIELGVAAAVMLISVGMTFLFKPEHMAPNPLAVRAGAGVQGLVLGALIGFVLVPFRMAAMSDAPPPPEASLAFLPAFVLLIIVRTGLLARAPFFGRFIRAYRRATVRWQISRAEQTLARLDSLEKRAEP